MSTTNILTNGHQATANSTGQFSIGIEENLSKLLLQFLAD
jgi:hypothetical protein